MSETDALLRVTEALKEALQQGSDGVVAALLAERQGRIAALSANGPLTAAEKQALADSDRTLRQAAQALRDRLAGELTSTQRRQPVQNAGAPAYLDRFG